MLSVSSPAALGGIESAFGGFRLADGTLETIGNGSYDRSFSVEPTGVAVIKNEGNLHLSRLNVSSGCLIKRGAGRLVVEPESVGKVKLAARHGTDSDGWDPNPKNADFDDAGTPPSGGYLGFNVAEGEVVLKGDSTVEFSEPYGCMVGMQTGSGSIPPSLTIDGATASFA